VGTGARLPVGCICVRTPLGRHAHTPLLCPPGMPIPPLLATFLHGAEAERLQTDGC